MLRSFARALNKFPIRGPHGHKTVVEMLTLLVDENTGDLSNSPYSRDVILLDEKSVTAELAHLSETDRYFSRSNVLEFVERVAHRIAWRMSGPFSAAWGAPREMICEALQFQLWTELCTIIPLRRLARVISRREANKAVLIPLPRLDLECLKQWESNELEPLILCWALQKQGCRAYLVTKGPINVAELSIRLRPSILALPRPGAGLGDGELPKGRPIIATEGMRGLDILVNEVEHASFLVGHNEMTPFAVPKNRLVGIGPVSQPTGFEMRLQQDSSNVVRGFKQYSAKWPKNPLSFYLEAILGPHFPFILARARSLVANAAIKEAYVCDHLFLGSAILAHAVKERGGSVILWPHSANPSNVFERDGKYFDKVVVLTQEARKSWKRLFPDKPITIQPRCMLPPQRQPREFKPSEPLTVVVFGGAPFLGRLPLFRVDSHVQCYRRFFLLASSAEFVRLKFKPKGWTETADWLVNDLTNNLIPVDIETRAAAQLDYPNMIFVTISHGSTALLEGIASGVPCMIVREQAIQDYTCIDRDVVPTGDVELVFRLIEQCRNMTYYNGLLDAQIKWLSHQTSDGSIGL